jgi:hypothetical protein
MHFVSLKTTTVTIIVMLPQISEILSRFERKGYKLVAIKLIVPSKEFAERKIFPLPQEDHHKGGAPPPEWTEGYLNGWLSQPMGVFGLRLLVLIGIAVAAAIVLVLFLIFICLSRRRRREDLAASLYPFDGVAVVTAWRSSSPRTRRCCPPRCRAGSSASSTTLTTATGAPTTSRWSSTPFSTPSSATATTNHVGVDVYSLSSSSHATWCLAGASCSTGQPRR